MKEHTAMTTDSALRAYGILLPHFGSGLDGRRVIDAAQTAEEFGFDSVWVRDHLVYEPHGSEDSDRSFLDLGVTLGAIAAATRRITLATGTLIPFRHPIHAARTFASIAAFSGPERLLVGIGVGSKDHEFELVGMGGWDRRVVVEEYVDIMRKAWSGQPFSASGEHYAFEDIAVEPAIVPSPPVWYAGASAAAVRRAVEYCDGWIPGRMPNRYFVERLDRMKRLADDAGVALPATGNIPYVVPTDIPLPEGHFDPDRILRDARVRYTQPDGSPLESLDDIDGAVMAGSAEDIVAAVERAHAAGVEHVVLDLRLTGPHYEAALERLGSAVLPALRSAAATSSR